MPSSWTHPTSLSEGLRPAQNRGTVRSLLLRNVSNLPVRIPAMEWDAISTGAKTMFRAYNGRAGATRELPVIPSGTECPRPCLLFARRYEGARGKDHRWDAIPGVLLSHRREPLGAISPEDLEREGFRFLPGFRFHWQRRYPTLGWRPWDFISVIEVRPLVEDDREWAATWLLDHVLGEWVR